MNVDKLKQRLIEIGQSLEKHPQALALIGLGSAGLEIERMDEFSDLDFFVIVAAGAKKAFIEDLAWMETICPVAYAFANTEDGYKLLFADGVFCEFAVFDRTELENAVFAPGRVIWKRPEVPEAISLPKTKGQPVQHKADWLIGEALTNLYIGLARDRRGEKLSAMRFIQMYAVDRLIELTEQVEAAQPAFRDEFSGERRFEQRFPAIAACLPTWMQGYERNRESALAILDFLGLHFEINQPMRQAILDYCQK